MTFAFSMLRLSRNKQDSQESRGGRASRKASQESRGGRASRKASQESLAGRASRETQQESPGRKGKQRDPAGKPWQARPSMAAAQGFWLSKE